MTNAVEHTHEIGAKSLRARLALALDVEDLPRARALAHELRDYFAIVKVGLELFVAEGPAAIETFIEEGFAVFADLKLHDIPTTVGRAARAIAKHGPSYVTVHTSGGLEMMKAAVEGLSEGAFGATAPVAFGITVLTSDAEAPTALLGERARLGKAAGLGGLVCAAPDLPLVAAEAPGLLRVVPGTRPPGAPSNDQARVATPAEALALGADLLVIGRAVTAASDRVRAAELLITSLRSQ